jgi:hypothetical protein
VDPRLRRAVDANVGWCAEILALHGIDAGLDGGLLVSKGPPPPLHSDVVVAEPTATLDDVLSALDGREHAGFKDSFCSIDASSAGMKLLFTASWIHRPATPGAATAWTLVTTATDLAAWNATYDTSEVLLATLLGRGHIKVLARREGDEIVAGAIARLGSGVVELSNVHAVGENAVDWNELTAAVAAVFPGRELVGYERGTDLDAALAGGFAAVGDLRVWVR